MSLELITDFFFWCFVINASLLMIWVLFMMFALDIVYKTQYKWFPISRESFSEIMYRFLGFYKLLILVFNLAPLIALQLVAS